MQDMNQCNFTGRIGNLELKYTPNGTAIMQFSLAVGDSKKGDNGQWTDQTTWIRCKAWKGAAEFMDRNTQKGTQIRITARVEVEEWEDKQTGQKRTATIFNVREVQPLSNRKDNNNQAGSQKPQQNQGWGQPQQPQAPKQASSNQAPQNEPPMDFDDDIPF
ncbi:single-stranded DNA-binding protein [Proteus mirabilis]|uniref:single-stranded DNA-binding protein n=2 Tax=Proteus mirabilis TaxID=584 RepID=UPI0031011522